MGGAAMTLAGFALGATPIAAQAQALQSQQQSTAGDEEIEQIIVTGTRLTTNKNLVAPNPVLTIGQDEITARGTVLIEDLVNQLPQVFAGQASEVSNGASGTATVNLRGLGSIRTLVLIDGRRLPFGSSLTSAPNLDLVPTRLIERLDIVTGGASAVYGSDAVAGVVNFILKRDFEGVEIDVQGGFHQAGNDSKLFENVLKAAKVPVPGSTIDGREVNVSLTMGTNTPDGRGNVTLFAHYENLAEITQDKRVYSACALSPDDGPFSFGGLGCVGSANFRLFGGPGGFVFQQEDGTTTPFQGGPAETFNFGPFNFFQRPIERFQIYARGHYEITDDIEMFSDLSFINTSTDAQIAPTASFGFGAYRINCDNPFIQNTPGVPLTEIFGCVPDSNGNIPEEVSGITASHRNVEGDPRNSNIDLTTWRLVGGFRGTFLDDFDFEVFGQFARTLNTEISENDFVVANLQDAFLVVNDANGNPVCKSGNSGCVPYNIFQRGPNGESLVTQDAIDFIQGVGIVTGETQQWIFGGNVQTDLGKFGIQSPLADSGVGFLVGGEYRQDDLVSTPDEISQVPGGGFTGVGGATLPVEGRVRVAEFYTEAQVPIISDKPFIEQFAVGGAYRFSDYRTDGNGVQNDFTTDTYHVFVNWTPHHAVRLRGQFQRAVRAPNVIELFTGQDQGLANLTPQANGLFDPCAGPNPLATLEQCERTGVKPSQFGNIIDVIAGQTSVITGGNPNLEPEVSDTYTFGAIITPDQIPGFTLSVDYFDIKVKKAISAGIPVQTILDNCLNTGDPAFCSLITRDAQGSLNSGSPGTGFLATNINIATLKTSGIDIQAVYDLDLQDLNLDGWGSVRFNYAATYLDSLSTTPFPGADKIECAGLFAGSCGTPNPHYRHRFRATWNTPWAVRADLTWRFFGSTNNDAGPDAGAPIDAKLERVQYLDLTLFYDITENLEFRAGVNNLNGKKPPVTTSLGPPFGNGNTAPTVYDATGRFFFFGLRYRL